MDDVIDSAFFRLDLVNAEEDILFDWDILIKNGFVLEEVADDLNHSFHYLQLDVRNSPQIFLTDSQVRHLVNELLLSVALHSIFHLHCLHSFDFTILLLFLRSLVPAF